MKDAGNHAVENFVSEQSAADFAKMYQQDGIRGGHIILLNAKDSEYFEATKQQALEALRVYPGGLQIGGGITAENASSYIEEGASHVIVTSYVFYDGKIDYKRLRRLVDAVGKKRLVLDLSCKKIDGEYRIVTNRWQNVTKEIVTTELMDKLSRYCDEFLIHAVDVEGKANGIEFELAEMLGQWDGLPVTYAGGVHCYEDLDLLKHLGQNRLNVTIGSALDLFGGSMKWETVLKKIKEWAKFFFASCKKAIKICA